MDKRQTSSFDERATTRKGTGGGPPVSSSAMFKQAQRRASLRLRNHHEITDSEDSNNTGVVQRQFINRYNLALRESKYMVPKLCQPGCKLDHEHFGIYRVGFPEILVCYKHRSFFGQNR